MVASSISTDKRIEPFVKWAGGKSQLLEQFKILLPHPNSYSRYIEPFLGGGALFFFLQPKKALLSDLNRNLVEAYSCVKNHLPELLDILHEYKQQHNKDFFLRIRKEYNAGNSDKVKSAANLIYLNKACFNGLYRVNKKGEFNVPYGQHKIFSVNDENFSRASNLLKHSSIKNESFEKVLNNAKRDDFVYFDPPYYPLQASSFTTYTNTSFLENEQNKLAEIFSILDKRGCKVMLSNSDTPFINNLYAKWNISKVYAKRYINCVAEKRGNVTEVVVRNYN